jgi:dipeptidase
VRLISLIIVNFFTISLSILVAGEARTCTVITVGKKASVDGSVITTHTVDSHRTSSAATMVSRAKHKKGEIIHLSKRLEDDTGPLKRNLRQPIGEIPQVPLTYGYLNPAYPPMNEHQVAIGESTFGGREELRTEKGLIDCETLQRLMLERARTAREAIQIGGDLISKYGWIDEGEALSIVDKEEAWVMEIVGPGKGSRGAIWAAKRIPDDHVAVFANASRIREISLGDKENFILSENVVSAAVEKGYWDPHSGEDFEFCYAYNPDGRHSFASTRREWRVFDLLKPSAKFHANQENFPFSIKPDKLVSVEQIMEIFRDTYEGTEYDMVKDLTVTDEETGKTVKSPLANPFMPYDANKLHKINGGWGWRGERSIARWYTMYTTITQSRGWLPDQVGGLIWFSYDNTAMTTYVPIYIGVNELPDDFQKDGRTTGFGRESAWWAFNRVSTIAGHRWGDMREDVAKVRKKLQQQIFDNQKEVEETATKLLTKSEKKARLYLTRYLKKAATAVVNSYWSLGDRLWNKYDERW